MFFSDAVFAIAITLLAIDIRLPDTRIESDEALRRALAELAPQIWAFALSFIVIAQFWIGHLRTFRRVERLDSRLLAINLLLLFFIALLPFPTSVVASEGDTPTGATLYATFVVLAGLLSTLLWVYPTRIAHLASADVSPDLARRIALRAVSVPVVFALSIPIALVETRLAWLVWFAAVPIQVVVSRWLKIPPSVGLIDR